MSTDAQKAARARYVKNNVKRVLVSFYPTDKDVFEWLDTKEAKPAYIRALLRREMEREVQEGQYKPK